MASKPKSDDPDVGANADTTTDGTATAVATGETVATPSPTVTAVAAPTPAPLELVVEQVAPKWWMKSPGGALFPAFDLGTRFDLEGSGCAVTDEVPEGGVAATESTR